MTKALDDLMNHIKRGANKGGQVKQSISYINFDDIKIFDVYFSV